MFIITTVEDTLLLHILKLSFKYSKFMKMVWSIIPMK